ncbi:hypothetical protein [Microcystis phage MJing1]|nr:hypothetical protein [Microcystis phage MJing1]
MPDTDQNKTAPALSDVLDRFIAACERIHETAERCRKAMQKPHGCICPPTAEATCRGPACPRQHWRMPT